MVDRVMKDDDEWRQLLTSEQYQVAREKGTEAPFSGKYHDFQGRGTYRCVCCGQDLFSADAKYDSGTGWPSFWAPVSEDHVETVLDTDYGMVRAEVRCPRCGAHLGHIFDDGPPPTGRRYCMNSTALHFVGEGNK
ncbi:MAG: peptide-methionine (R)-S-oxide reductase MsrB [Dehalococcoidales bacterium]|nr:peptide-methionine (R)-S-oxide reductase MsrB [Dehalococcoidales bacterium]